MSDVSNASTPGFSERVRSILGGPLLGRAIDTLQVNLGYRCNMACAHWNVSAGPGRQTGFMTINAHGGWIDMQPLDDHNRRLLDNVRPGGWKNPDPASCYNLVVIGAGTAGLVTAAGAAGLGAKVALVERGLFGGDCLNTGCVPSKGLLRAARAAHDARTAGEFGVACERASPDFGAAMARMRGLRVGISVHDSVARFTKELGVDVFLGEGSFTAPGILEVDGKRLRFRKAAICTGSRPAVPDAPGFREAGFLTNETIFELTALPPRIAVLGGGPIGCEMAQAFARMGSRVDLLVRGGQVLPREDADAAAIIQRSLERDGVTVRLNTGVRSVAGTGGEKVVALASNGATSGLAVDQILAAVGRLPNVDGLGLEKAGVAFDRRRGVVVDDRLRTSNRNVYAAGDVCSAYQFTHAADAMARIVIANSLFRARQKAADLIIPWCTYTDPEIAHVGMFEHEASEKGIDVLTLTVPLADVDRAVLDGETEGFARVHLKKGSDRILGATVVARHAGDLISELTLAMTARTGLSAIGKTIHPYPTQGEVIRKLADRFNRMRLTPRIAGLFRAWFRWQRK